MFNDDETLCSLGIKVINCTDCIFYWEKENPEYLKFLQNVDSRGMTLNINGEEIPK